jgi:pilin/secretion family protein with methylation motif
MRSRHAGFTIVEVMLAMGLFLFGISALLGMFQVGGGFEASARTHAELAPVIEPLIEQIRSEAWLLDSSGQPTEIRQYFDVPVPGVPAFKYALFVNENGGDPNLRLAELHFYRRDPERIEASVAFLLPRRVPASRRLSEQTR